MPRPQTEALTPATRSISLAGQQIAYHLRRSRRRTIGLTIDQRGLRVGAPLQARLGDIESLILQHGQWVLDKLAAQRAVELGDTGRDAFGLAGLDFRKIAQARHRGERLVAMAGRLFRHAFDQRVPFRAAGALTLPFRAGGAALGATVDRLAFCHDARRIH